MRDRLQDKLRVSTFVVFALLLIGSMLYRALTGEEIVGWTTQIILLTVLMFVGIGDRITELVIGREGISIKQQVRNYEKDMERVDEFTSEENPPDQIIEVVEYSLGRPRDVWSKLLIIRMTLQRLLRSTAEARGIQFRPSAGIMTMNENLKQRGIIDETLSGEVERIRAATFTVEWGAGVEADPEDVQFTLENYRKVFAKLKARMSSIAPTQ